MDKTSEKVTKDPKRAEKACKGRKNYMNKFKESILNDTKTGSGDTINASNETTSATNITTSDSITNNTATTRPNDTYVSGVGIFAALAIGVCLFFVYGNFQPKNKRFVNENQDQSPKRRHMF